MAESTARRRHRITVVYLLLYIGCDAMIARTFFSRPAVQMVATYAATSLGLFSGRALAVASEPNLAAATASSSSKPIHMIVLVHGWLGSDMELKYLEEALREQASYLPSSSRFVIYSSKTNVGRTSDGIAPGGERLANEVMDQIQSYTTDSDTTKVTLSFVGNSLGGLYARYALSKLDWTSDQIQPLIFCTTATPHLGISNHTYLPIPRWAERLVAYAMQPTGQDMFRVTSILEEMTREAQFLNPLAKFRKRIAYANAFWTDFQVPTTTAAFLSDSSSYPHLALQDSSPHVALKVETPPNHAIEEQENSNDDNNDNDDTRRCLSHFLDSLGWTKVFCDVRNEIPVPPLPLLKQQDEDDTSSSFSDKNWTSRELIPAMTSFGSRWHFPLGHTVMVANSKSELYARINAKGRPIMDQLAAELVANIQAMEEEEDDEPKRQCNIQ